VTREADEIAGMIAQGEVAASLSERDIWFPEIQYVEAQQFGKRWPTVIFSLFETNRLGERRFVDTKTVDLNE
jgi:hypothetical protein